MDRQQAHEAVAPPGVDCVAYEALAAKTERLIEDHHKARLEGERSFLAAKQAAEQKLSAFEKWEDEALSLVVGFRKKMAPVMPAGNIEAGINKAMEDIRSYRSAYSPGMFKKLELRLNARGGAEYINSAGQWFERRGEELVAERDLVVSKHEAAAAKRLEDAESALDALVTEAEKLCERVGASALPWDSEAWREAEQRSSTPIVRLTETAFHRLGDHEHRFPVLARIPGEHLGISSEARDRLGCDFLTPIFLRALRAVEPGKLRILMIDATTLGDAFAPVLGIGDLNEEVIHTKVWTTEQDIRARLEEATARVSLIIQKYLTGDYATIDEYNEQAGEVAEPYEIIAINDFPHGLDRRSVEMVQSLAEVGPRAGVSLLLVPGPATNDDRDRLAGAVYGLIPLWLRPVDASSFATQIPAWCLDFATVTGQIQQVSKPSFWSVRRPTGHRWHVNPSNEPSPPEHVVQSVLDGVGRKYAAGSRVEVTLERVWHLMAGSTGLEVAPAPEDPTTWWRGDSLDGLKIALGRQGSRGVCALELNSELQSSALLVGRPGSGKSNLLHNVIMSASALYAPEELALYMLDFREAVEFAAYAVESLPHARAVALEADREFGLSVLQAVVAEMEDRGVLFRETGGEQASIVTYRQATGRRIPRILLVIDEFHRMFDREDSVASEAAQALDTIIRLGRGFGVHCLLASQTLMGMTALGRHTLNQVQVRIALQCLEEDARIVLSDGNNGPSLLTRPGEGIFNASAGREAHNQPFQAPLIPETQRLAFLRSLRAHADADGIASRPVVYRRNETVPVASLPPRADVSAMLRIGRPVSLAPCLELRLAREGSRNVLVVGRNEVLATGMVVASLEDLAGIADSQVEVEVFDFGARDGIVSSVAERLGYRLRRRAEFAGGLTEIKAVIESRMDGDSDQQTIVVLLNALTKARDLDPEDYDEAAQRLAGDLQSIVRDGPEVGVHVLAVCDSVANLTRRIDRRIQREFGIRIAFAMSSEDSQQLLDSEAAVTLEDREAVLVDLDASQTTKFQPLAL
jgi:S-DNA-T family DNA segregation ATPase FtsK/SpoIIIE